MKRTLKFRSSDHDLFSPEQLLKMRQEGTLTLIAPKYAVIAELEKLAFDTKEHFERRELFYGALRYLTKRKRKKN